LHGEGAPLIRPADPSGGDGDLKKVVMVVVVVVVVVFVMEW
jgi:hypothetical protein